MSSKLKVTFIDNASKQYDANASLIVTDGGKLYLGDRSSASFLQLKSRSCKSVVNADKSTHGLSKEDDVNYLNIDSYGESSDDNFDIAYNFILSELKKNNNVTVMCETGNGKSAAVVVYYVMRRKGLCLQESIDVVKSVRDKIKIKPEVIALLRRKENKLGLRKKAANASVTGSGRGIYILAGVILFFAFLYGILYLFVGKL